MLKFSGKRRLAQGPVGASHKPLSKFQDYLATKQTIVVMIACGQNYEGLTPSPPSRIDSQGTSFLAMLVLKSLFRKPFRGGWIIKYVNNCILWSCRLLGQTMRAIVFGLFRFVWQKYPSRRSSLVYLVMALSIRQCSNCGVTGTGFTEERPVYQKELQIILRSEPVPPDPPHPLPARCFKD
jgi:hypothetical protein